MYKNYFLHIWIWFSYVNIYTSKSHIHKCIANRKINHEENEKIGALQRRWTCVQLHEIFYVNGSHHSLLKYSECLMSNYNSFKNDYYYYDIFCIQFNSKYCKIKYYTNFIIYFIYIHICILYEVNWSFLNHLYIILSYIALVKFNHLKRWTCVQLH